MRFSQFLKSWRVQGAKQFAELMGGIIAPAAIRGTPVTVAYSAAPAINAALGNDFIITIADGVAFVVAAPTNVPPTGYSQVIRITFRNASGGAHGAGTFNAAFKTSGNVPAIANGNSRTIAFRWDGANWVEIFRTAADVAN